MSGLTDQQPNGARGVNGLARRLNREAKKKKGGKKGGWEANSRNADLTSSKEARTSGTPKQASPKRKNKRSRDGAAEKEEEKREEAKEKEKKKGNEAQRKKTEGEKRETKKKNMDGWMEEGSMCQVPVLCVFCK